MGLGARRSRPSRDGCRDLRGDEEKVNAIRTKKSLAEHIVSDVASQLVGMEAFKGDRTGATGAILALRQVVLALEKRGFCLKADTDRCFEIVSMLDREGA